MNHDDHEDHDEEDDQVRSEHFQARSNVGFAA